MIEICPVCWHYNFSRSAARNHYSGHVQSGELERTVQRKAGKNYTSYRLPGEQAMWTRGYIYKDKADSKGVNT